MTPPTPGAFRRRGVVRLFSMPLSILLVGGALAWAAPQDAAPPGVVVEEVAYDSSAAKAGLQPGDVLVSWSRAAAAGADVPAAGGTIHSAFDLVEVELDHAPRGAITFSGRRGEAEMRWVLPPVPFGLTVRSPLREELLALHQQARDLVESKAVPEGAERWRAASQAAKVEGQQELAVWFLSRAARALSEAPLWPEADTAHKAAIAEAEAGAPPRATAQVLREWGDTLLARSLWAPAEDCFRRALALDERLAAESLTVARDLDKLGRVALGRSDLPAAETCFQRALTLRQALAPDSLDIAASFGHIATLAVNRGDHVAATDYDQRAVAINERLAPGSLALARSLNNLAVDFMYREELATAEHYLRRSLAIRETLDPVHGASAQILVNLGSIAHSRWDLDGAMDYFKRSLAIAEKWAPDSNDVADALYNLGSVSSDRGDLDAAEQYYRRSLAITEKLAPDTSEVAYPLTSLGGLALKRGDFDTAQELCGRALAIFERLAPDSLWVAHALDKVGRVAHARGDLGAAEQYYARALSIHERLAHVGPVDPETPHALAMVRRDLGRPEEASRLLLQALDAIESQGATLGGTDESQTGFAAIYSRYYHDTMEVLVDLGRPAEALHVLERSRARSLLALLAERDLLFSADISPELARERRTTDAEYDRVQAALANLSPGKDAAQIQATLGQLRELRAKQEEIAGRVRQASPRLASLQYPRPLDLAGVRSALDPGTLLVAYSVGTNKTLAFTVEPEGGPGSGLSVFALPVGEKALREKVTSLREGIQEVRRVSPQVLAARAAELYDLLLRPLEARAGKSRRLLLSPDGPLHALPFGALVRTEPGAGARAAYLLEWKPLHIVASATVYAELRKSRRERPPSAGALVAFGDPDYPRQVVSGAGALGDPEVHAAVTRGLSLGPLPFTRDEVEGIAALFPNGARKFLGEQATEERAKSVGKEVRYLHFACHGSLDERFPLNSALVLAIPAQPAAGQDNGLLQAWEIFDHVRIDADLVTLSACSTGLGKEMGGEGLLGLTRAFLYAGARSVLATLWDVSDKSTPQLMKRFYRHLRLGQSRDEALRAAQIELIRTPPSPRLAHPFYWSAFQLSGDWR